MMRMRAAAARPAIVLTVVPPCLASSIRTATGDHDGLLHGVSAVSVCSCCPSVRFPVVLCLGPVASARLWSAADVATEDLPLRAGGSASASAARPDRTTPHTARSDTDRRSSRACGCADSGRPCAPSPSSLPRHSPPLPLLLLLRLHRLGGSRPCTHTTDKRTHNNAPRCPQSRQTSSRSSSTRSARRMGR
jgi:hypothetical protein